MTEKTAVERWAPRSLEQLVEELSELARRAAAGEPTHRPALTLFLKSGREIEGLLLGVHADRQGQRTLLVHVPGPERFAAQDVAHVPLASLEAITLRDLGRLEAPPPGAPPPPTRLELRRRVAATQSALAVQLGQPVTLTVDAPEEPNALDALAHLEALLVEVLGHVASSALGKEALRGVAVISLLAKENPSAALENGTLTLTTGVTHPRRFTVKELEAAIEKVL